MQPADALARVVGRDPNTSPARILLVVAHPDDDAVGCGGRLTSLGANTSVAFATDGAPHNPKFYRDAGFVSRAEYAEERRKEAQQALALAGVPEHRTYRLEHADQCAALELVPLARSIASLVKRTMPEILLTHAYEGGHPDHDAVAFASHAACKLLRAEGMATPPIIEFAEYRDEAGTLAAYRFLPIASSADETVELRPEERALKQRMFECHRTQTAVLAQFPIEIEAYRVAPDYDFTTPPGPTIYYDRFDWGMRAERFCALTRTALEELGL